MKKFKLLLNSNRFNNFHYIEYQVSINVEMMELK